MHMQFPEAAEVLGDCHFQWSVGCLVFLSSISAL